MKTHSRSPKSRPVAAILIVAATVFLLLGTTGSATCGVLGALVAGSVNRLLGSAGLGLLCVTAWALAFILATPPGTASRLVVAIWRHTVAHRHTPSVVVMRQAALPYVPAPGERLHPFMNAAAIAPAEVSTHPMPTRDRRALDDVRTALKSLGYLKNEYEPLVARMDPSLGFEKLVKTALKHLQVN